MKNIYYTVFYLLALSAIIYLGVDAFYQILEAGFLQVSTDEVSMGNPPDNQNRINRPLKYFQAIMDRNLFGSVDKAKLEEAPVAIETLEPTSLKIALMGTVAGDQKNAVAVIEDKKKNKQDLYRVGDSVLDALVKKILRGKVVLGVGGKDEILTIADASSSPASSSPPSPSPRTAEKGTEPETRTGSVPGNLERTITMRRTDIDESLQDLNALLSQARIQPHFENGEADGLAVTGITAGSIFMKMGLRNGDIVNAVNEKPITSPDDILAMYNDMQSGSSLSIQIKRGGQERTINYSFLE
jgi:general secretion pathway protein C